MALNQYLSMDMQARERSQSHNAYYTTYVHCDIVRPAITVCDANMMACSVVGSRLAARLRQRRVMAHHPRTLFVFNACKMRWLDASWTRKLIGARIRYYINYNGCPSVIVLILNLLNSRSSLVHLLLVCTLSVWLAQLVKTLAAPTHVRSCVQEIRVRSPERTSSTLASIPLG